MTDPVHEFLGYTLSMESESLVKASVRRALVACLFLCALCVSGCGRGRFIPRYPFWYRAPVATIPQSYRVTIFYAPMHIPPGATPKQRQRILHGWNLMYRTLRDSDAQMRKVSTAAWHRMGHQGTPPALAGLPPVVPPPWPVDDRPKASVAKKGTLP